MIQNYYKIKFVLLDITNYERNVIRMEKKLKMTLIILLIILISIISFAGIFIQDTKFMKNLIPSYQLGMDLDGYRAVTIAVNDDTEKVYYDKDGNEVEEETKDGYSKDIPINSEDVLTKDNYLKTKQIIEKRLDDLNIPEYLIRLNEDNGTITVQLPENDMTDTASQFLYSRGIFTIENENGEVLLDNSDLKKVQVGYTNTGTNGTTIYLSFHFNEESFEKLKEITKTYVDSTDKNGNDTSKKVSIKIDESPLIETTFDEEISNGILSLTLGTSTDNSTLNSYIEQASNIAILLNNGNLPITYEVEQNRFIKSDITLNDAIIPAIILGIVLIIAFVFLLIKYKKRGIIAIVSHIGYLAVLLIVIRYTNLVITMEGICGILISAILNYILLIYILQILKNKELNIVEYKKIYNKSILQVISVLIPTIIIGIVLCFSTWLPAYSFGTIIFWGALIMAIYNAIITRMLFLNSLKEKN